MSSSVTWWAWGLAGAFFTLVALPLASSSPYPTPSRQEWSDAPAQMALASASSVLARVRFVDACAPVGETVRW